MKNQMLLLLIFFCIMLNSCGSPDVAGATSETTNGVVVSIAVNQDGLGVPNADVYLSEEYSLRELDAEKVAPYTRTDSEGNFSIDTLDTLNYLVEVVDSIGDRVMASITYNSDLNDHSLQKEQLKLEPSGLLWGKININPTQKAVVQIYGLDRSVIADSEGIFRFDDLPEGEVTFRIVIDSVVHYEREIYSVYSNDETDCGVFEVNQFAIDSVKVRHFFALNNLPESLFKPSVVEIKNGSIVGINVDDMDVDTLPPSLFELDLIKLSVARTRIRRIPDEIGNLKNTEYIDFSGNGLTTLPDALALMESCTTIDIQDNEFTTLPEVLMRMPNIQLGCLTIDENRLHNVDEPVKNWLDSYSTNRNWAETQKQ